MCSRKTTLIAMAAVMIAAAAVLAAPAGAIDINIDGIGSITAGSGTDKLDKAIGLLTVIEDKWFLAFDVIGVILLSIGALVLRFKNPDAWARYMHYILALLMFVASPAIYKALKALAQAAI